MSQPPERIFLQWDCELDEPSENDPADCTWCQDQVNATDVEYVRLTPDLHRLMPPVPLSPRQIDFEDDEDDAPEPKQVNTGDSYEIFVEAKP